MSSFQDLGVFRSQQPYDISLCLTVRTIRSVVNPLLHNKFSKHGYDLAILVAIKQAIYRSQISLKVFMNKCFFLLSSLVFPLILYIHSLVSLVPRLVWCLIINWNAVSINMHKLKIEHSHIRVEGHLKLRWQSL